jgi:hypothetical protein
LGLHTGADTGDGNCREDQPDAHRHSFISLFA